MLDFSENKYYTVNDMLNIMEILRSDKGCPWDKEQTHSSIRNNFIEEVYEAVEAIDKDDKVLLREELGDVLLQIVFHCQLEAEQGSFVFGDIVNELCHKLIIRHPHVFGNVAVNNTSDVLINWEKIKNKTKGTSSYTETLTNVPACLPALMRAEKVGKRAAKAVMDFDDLSSALSSLSDEIKELEQEIGKVPSDSRVTEELGDVLFSCVNVARKLGVSAEEALTRSTEKFISRFSEVEDQIRLSGIDMKSLSIDELNVFWDRAKEKFNG